MEIAFGPAVGSIVVFVHPEAVCVEPITAWPDAIRLSQNGCPDAGLVLLRAGESLSAWTRWTRTTPAR